MIRQSYKRLFTLHHLFALAYIHSFARDNLPLFHSIREACLILLAYPTKLLELPYKIKYFFRREAAFESAYLNIVCVELRTLIINDYIFVRNYLF